MNEDVSVLVGKTLTSINNTGDEIIFTTDKDEVYKLYHDQDCCESVRVEDVNGDFNDLIGTPLLLSEQVSNEDYPKPEGADSCTWTFYRFGTVKGFVDVRWLGESNGYYSESVDFIKVK